MRLTKRNDENRVNLNGRRCKLRLSVYEVWTQVEKTTLAMQLFICIFDMYVSAPVHPHVLIIFKTHENRVEHILGNITNNLTAKNYF
jgi:hypothetical protein